MNKNFLIFWRILDRVSARISTIWAKLRFWPFMRIAKNSYVGWRVKVSPYWKSAFQDGSTLKIILAGKNRIGRDTTFQGSGEICFGLGSYCGEKCIFGCNEYIKIGKNVIIASAVSIRDTDHIYSDITKPMRQQGIKTAPVVIEDDVWIGHGVVILKGVTVGKGAIVAASTVVTKNINPYSIVGGIPASVINTRS